MNRCRAFAALSGPGMVNGGKPDLPYLANPGGEGLADPVVGILRIEVVFSPAPATIHRIMRIVHYYAQGAVCCGILDSRQRVRGLGSEPSLADRTARQQLDCLLTLAPEQRQSLNDRLIEQAPVAMERADRLAPAIPDPPLYYYLHGNATTIWKRQMGGKSAWDLARSPHNRIRPWSSLAGHGQRVEISRGAGLSTGTEFAVVIGKPARRVAARDAAAHIAGIVPTNDGFLHQLHPEFDTTAAANNTVHTQALHTLYKSADGMGGVGPCIVTVEEVERDMAARAGTDRIASMRQSTGRLACLYDLITRNYRNDACVDRGHTSAILLDAEYIIAYLSRFMTLRTGSIIGLGSAGWDGQHAQLAELEGATEVQDFEIEDYGRHRLNLVRTGAHASRTQSPLIAERVALGLPPLPASDERTTRALWMARGNCRDGGAVDNVPDAVGLCPFLIPWTAIGDDHSPIVIPPHATHVDVCVQLAAVVGEAPIYNATLKDALAGIRGFAVLLALRDRSLVESIPNPMDYEARPAHLAGYYADGFFRLGPVTPLGSIADWRRLAMRVRDHRGRIAQSTAADYRYDLSHMITMVSRTTTLLPGDILSLGRAGDVLTLSADQRLEPGATLTAEIDGLNSITFPVDDQRDPAVQNDNRDFLRPTR